MTNCLKTDISSEFYVRRSEFLPVASRPVILGSNLYPLPTVSLLESCALLLSDLLDCLEVELQVRNSKIWEGQA